MKLNQVINNVKWIVVCKVLQALLQMAVGMLCARYLGPSNYGLINYAASIVSFALPIMRLGLNATLVHELIENPEKEGQIMGTSLAMNLLSSLACMAGVFCFVSVANRGDPTTIIVCMLYSVSLIFGAVEMIQYWYQYKLMAKYASLIMLASYIIVSAYKLFLLVTSKSVFWFAMSNTLDYGIIGVSLTIIFLWKGNKLSFSMSTARKMLGKSKHYILSAMMVTIFQSTDHIMLTTIIGNSENGIYSAASTCATMTLFVYLGIIDSYRPLILACKKEDNSDYERNLARLLGVIVYLSAGQAVVFSLLAKLIVYILYGSAYATSVPVLRVLTWYFVFSCMGSVRNVWILAEQKQQYLWGINLSGALINVVLNAVLIPGMGACGAAIASMLTQFVTNFALCFVFKPIRDFVAIMKQGLNPLFVYGETKLLIHSMRKRK